MASERVTYNDRIVGHFIIASLVWALIAMALGVLLAVQLIVPSANLAPPISFATLRPVHTNAMLFAFVGNMVFAGMLYSSQRLLKARLPSNLGASLHFWGWQLAIAAGLATIPLGHTQGKEYAELEWPFDLAIAVLWLLFAINFFRLISARRERRLYVAIWFYIATVVSFGLFHIVGNLAIPTGLLESVSLFGGSRDAMVHWFYAHNAISFFMTMPVLGIMYYVVPAASGRPLYSYRLAVTHFWALVFLFAWAGPHHLLSTALPNWAQALGVIFSILLWAPSWGGALNGLATLRGSWDQLRVDPVLKFLAAGVAVFAIVSLEGPLLALPSVSARLHFTDWIVGHAHASGLGWNGFMAAGMFYWLVPKLWNTELRSRRVANLHFVLAGAGLFVYVSSMWIAGATQGAMWQAENPEGGLAYPSFVETMVGLEVLYLTRLAGGVLYLVGFVIMAWNIAMTILGGRRGDETVEVRARANERHRGFFALVFGPPMINAGLVLALLVGAALLNPGAALALLMVATLVAVFAVAASGLVAERSWWHRALEERASAFAIAVLIAISAGSVIELGPTIAGKGGFERAADADAVPYTLLELAGREVYLEEGCHNCHSQMVRPFLWETARYPGVPTAASESADDHPFQWGSRRIGPDLARVGGKYPHSWHLEHMREPRLISPGSNMPAYPHLEREPFDLARVEGKVAALVSLGVPIAAERPADQAATLLTELAAELEGLGGALPTADKKIVALIAYLQRLGREPVAEPVAEPAAEPAPPTPTTPTTEGAR